MLSVLDLLLDISEQLELLKVHNLEPRAILIHPKAAEALKRWAQEAYKVDKKSSIALVYGVRVIEESKIDPAEPRVV